MSMRHYVHSHSSIARTHLRAPFCHDRRYTSIINYFRKLKDFDRPLFENISVEYCTLPIFYRHGPQFAGKILAFCFESRGIYQSASKTTITHFPAGTRSFILWISWNIVLRYQKQISKVIHFTFRSPPDYADFTMRSWLNDSGGVKKNEGIFVILGDNFAPWRLLS